ncbi:MAG: Sec-independent protein translocase subunit TatA [Mycobacteriales bacterium]
MNLPSGWELVLLLVVAVLLFGAKRLPDAARSAGRSLRIFKAEVKGLGDDDKPDVDDDARPSAAPTAADVPPATRRERR